jgi:DNA-binding CsgD family transcriptional regulator
MKEETTSRAVAKLTRVTDRELLLEWHAAKEYVMKVERALLKAKEYMKKVELALLNAKVDAESLRVSVKGLVSQKSPISPREREVFDGIMRHLFNKQIASELHISVRTVKFHVCALLRKLGKSGRHDLVESDIRQLPINEMRGREFSRRGGEKSGRQDCVPHGYLEIGPRNFEQREKSRPQSDCERGGRTSTTEE